MGRMFYEAWLQVPIPAERPIAAAINGLGGHIELNPQHHVIHVSLGDSRVTDTNLQLLVALHNLYNLDLSHSSITDAGLAHLGPLEQLRELRLANTQVTDAGLQHLKTLTQLTRLDLSGTQVTDAGLQHLKTLTQLTVLNLSGTQVTDAGLEDLRGFESLGNLWLRDTKVTDDGRLNLVIKLTKLQLLDNMSSSRYSTGAQLDLHGTNVSEAGLRLLGQMDRLVYLNLAETSIMDADLELLATLKLISLDLRHTKVTDAGLVHLEAIQTLEYLHLDDTAVTADGVAKLSEKLPRCAFPR
jgi:Leucine-rich repeat (LRR) protein